MQPPSLRARPGQTDPIRSQPLKVSYLSRVQNTIDLQLGAVIGHTFDLAYNAAHVAALSALCNHEYRSENRYLVFQCMEHPLSLKPDQWRLLDQAHKKRNLPEFEREFDVTVGFVEEPIAQTENLIDAASTFSNEPYEKSNDMRHQLERPTVELGSDLTLRLCSRTRISQSEISSILSCQFALALEIFPETAHEFAKHSTI